MLQCGRAAAQDEAAMMPIPWIAKHAPALSGLITDAEWPITLRAGSDLCSTVLTNKNAITSVCEGLFLACSGSYDCSLMLSAVSPTVGVGDVLQATLACDIADRASCKYKLVGGARALVHRLVGTDLDVLHIHAGQPMIQAGVLATGNAQLNGPHGDTVPSVGCLAITSCYSQARSGVLCVCNVLVQLSVGTWFNVTTGALLHEKQQAGLLAAASCATRQTASAAGSCVESHAPRQHFMELYMIVKISDAIATLRQAVCQRRPDAIRNAAWTALRCSGSVNAAVFQHGNLEIAEQDDVQHCLMFLLNECWQHIGGESNAVGYTFFHNEAQVEPIMTSLDSGDVTTATTTSPQWVVAFARSSGSEALLVPPERVGTECGQQCSGPTGACKHQFTYDFNVCSCYNGAHHDNLGPVRRAASVAIYGRGNTEGTTSAPRIADVAPTQTVGRQMCFLNAAVEIFLWLVHAAASAQRKTSTPPLPKPLNNIAEMRALSSPL